MVVCTKTLRRHIRKGKTRCQTENKKARRRLNYLASSTPRERRLHCCKAQTCRVSAATVSSSMLLYLHRLFRHNQPPATRFNAFINGFKLLQLAVVELCSVPHKYCRPICIKNCSKYQISGVQSQYKGHNLKASREMSGFDVSRAFTRAFFLQRPRTWAPWKWPFMNKKNALVWEYRTRNRRLDYTRWSAYPQGIAVGWARSLCKFRCQV